MASYSKNESSGLWSVRFRIIEDNKEVNKRISGFKQKKEAISAYNVFMATYIAPLKTNENYDLTMNQLFGLYKQHINARQKESSQYDTEHCYCKHIAATFGNLKIIKIKKHDILQWQNMLNQKGFKYRYKTKLRCLLSTILNFAVRYYDLPFNVVLQVENFRNLEEQKEMQVLSVNEFQQFISVIKDNMMYKLFFTLLYLTGCRKGEAFALTWNDIDFDKKILSISKSLTRKVNDSPYKITTPKNKSSNRKILIPDDLMRALLIYKESLTAYDCGHLIFGGNTPLAEQTVTRVLQRTCIKANVKIITPHDFRHSHASLLISLGESIVMVSKRLGHANIEQTLNTYSHLMPNDEYKMIEKLNNVLVQN